MTHSLFCWPNIQAEQGKFPEMLLLSEIDDRVGFWKDSH
jgi:hypothetical protein